MSTREMVCDTAAMTLQVVGAGLPRTGTTSLKEALTTLLGGPCYHMFELFGHPEHLPSWQAATDGEPVDWTTVFGSFRAAVDWPTSAFWPELIDAYPDAIVLLSTRSSPETWWASASSTVFPAMRSSPDPDESDWTRMIFSMVESRFTADVRRRSIGAAGLRGPQRRGARSGAGRPPARLAARRWMGTDLRSTRRRRTRRAVPALEHRRRLQGQPPERRLERFRR